MGASQFIGRVGGLAVALGVGFLMSGNSVAWADSPDTASRDAGAASASRESGASTRGPRASANRQARASSASAVRVPASTQSVVPVISPAAAAPVSDGSNGPVAPVDPSSLTFGLAEVVRRANAVASGASTPSASATAAAATATVSNNGVSAAPTVTISNGIISGTLNAVSERGATLSYSVVDSSAGAKLALGTGPSATPTAQDFTVLPYATWLDAATPSQVPSGTQSVNVKISEVTPFDSFVTGIPLIGAVAVPVINLLQQLPLISTLLAPIIGAQLVAAVNVDVGSLSAGRPVAFTYKVPSFDGTLLSTNWFPSVSVANAAVGAAQSPTVLAEPGLGSAGQVNPYAEWGLTNQTPGVGTLRTAVLSGPAGVGYNVVTWDPRGEFASGGILQLDNPFFEGRDVSAVINWISANPATKGDRLDPTNPAVGMVGGSYGGGIQLTAAGIDQRIDAIVPDIAWNNLNDSLYPSEIFRTAYASLLLLSLVTTGARINDQIYAAVLTGDIFGFISETAQAILASSGPGGPDPTVPSLLSNVTAPTLLTQGTVDVLFPLQQSILNAQALANGQNPTTKAIWFCGGHGVCSDFPSDSTQGVAQAALLKTGALAWLDQYVNPAQTANAANNLPNFQWVDQLGNINSASTLPYQTGFNDLPNITGTSTGGPLAVLPFSIGGSGPGAGTLPYSAGNASEAYSAINVDVSVPAGTQVVGAPTVSFTYSGRGTARAVYAQVIDKSTGRVLGNTVTPIPVTLDGQQHQVTFEIGQIAYTYGGTTDPGQLTVQITGSATAFWNSAWGSLNISDLSVALPNRNPAMPATIT